MRPFIRSPFNYDAAEASLSSGLICSPNEDRTQQKFKDECDINVIVRRFGITGQLPTDGRIPMYGDFTGIGDYRDALDAIRLAEQSFLQLPAAIRRELGDDPQRFVEFCQDPKNLPQLKEWGLTRTTGPVNDPGASTAERLRGAGAAPRDVLQAAVGVPPQPKADSSS